MYLFKPDQLLAICRSRESMLLKEHDWVPMTGTYHVADPVYLGGYIFPLDSIVYVVQSRYNSTILVYLSGGSQVVIPSEDITPEQIEELENSISEVGYVNPL